MAFATRSKDLVLFAIFGAMMFVSHMAMQWLPNVHFIAVFIAAFTLTYRVRALIPLYVYVMLYGLFYGFSMWWLAYLYVWIPLWVMFMIAGLFRISAKVKTPLYMLLAALHGLSFGILCAPVQAWVFGLSLQGMVAWVMAGLPFDVLHGISNFATGVLIVPLAELLKKLEQGRTHYAPD